MKRQPMFLLTGTLIPTQCELRIVAEQRARFTLPSEPVLRFGDSTICGAANHWYGDIRLPVGQSEMQQK